MKVSALYGDGFYYIPGTQTCIKFGGFLRTEWDVNAGGSLTTFTAGTNAQFYRTGDQLTTRARGVLTYDVREQSSYGTLRAYLAGGWNYTSNDSPTLSLPGTQVAIPAAPPRRAAVEMATATPICCAPSSSGAASPSARRRRSTTSSTRRSTPIRRTSSTRITLASASTPTATRSNWATASRRRSRFRTTRSSPIPSSMSPMALRRPERCGCRTQQRCMAECRLSGSGHRRQHPARSGLGRRAGGGHPA